MPGLLRFSTVREGPASPLCRVTRTPFVLMQQCPPVNSRDVAQRHADEHVAVNMSY